MSLDRYNTFGLKKNWLRGYLKDVHGFFLVEHIELNPQKQVPALRNWLREALLLNPDNLEPTPLAIFLAEENLFERDDRTLWQIVWANLAKGSRICAEYVQAFGVWQSVSKKDTIIPTINGRVPSASKRTVKNAVDALVNLITKSPLGSDMFDITRKGKAVTSITRKPADITHAALGYFIFSYAERHKRIELTVSELVDPTSPDSLATVFGATADTLEPGLRALQNTYHLIDAQLSMGLDNVIVREGKTPLNALEIITSTH